MKKYAVKDTTKSKRYVLLGPAPHRRDGMLRQGNAAAMAAVDVKGERIYEN